MDFRVPTKRDGETQGADANYSELVRWVSIDDSLRSVLMSVRRGESIQNDARGAKTPEWHRPILKRLEGAWLVTCTSDSDGELWVKPTEVGRTIAGFLAQHEARDELNEMFEKMPLPPDAVLLDLGCGAGPALVKACELSPRLAVGVDINRQALLTASGILGSRSATCALVQADITKLPFKAEAFSHAICRLAIPYVDQVQAIGEMGRVLKREGAVFLQLHPWQFYVKLLLTELRSWKRVVLNSFCVMNGGLFHLTGYQLKVGLRGGNYQELYQTQRDMKRLLGGVNIAVEWIDSGKLFRILGRKADTPRP